MSIFTPRVSGKKELSLANDYIKNKEYKNALVQAKKALIIIREKGDPKETAFANAKVLEIQGLLHEEANNLKNASSAFGQSGRYYLQSDMTNDQIRVLKKQANLLIQIGRTNAASKKFESAASSFEEAAVAYKQINFEVEALELKAKAFVFRAASVRNPPDRKAFLLRAVNLFEESGIDKPIVYGHLEYYSAMAERLSDKNKAIQSLHRAIEYYKQANNKLMIGTANAMLQTIENE